MTTEVARYPRFSVSAAVREIGAAQDALSWPLPLISEAAAHAVRQSGDWSVGRNLAHLVVYEERIVLPVLAALAEGEDGRDRVASGEEDWFAREAELLGDEPYAALRQRFQTIVRRHLEQLKAFDEEAFNAPLCSLWASGLGVLVPAGWCRRRASSTYGSTDTP